MTTFEVPRVRSSISGPKSREKFRKHSESTLRTNSEFLGFVLLETLKPWEIKHIPPEEEFQKCATPNTVGTVSFFGGASP